MAAGFFVAVVLGVVLLFVGARLRDARRADYIRVYAFPRGLIEKLQQRRPGLAAKDAQLVARALRQFFLAHLKSGRRYVSMPSQITDDLWHEFILYTRHYQDFCRRAFGRFLHHTPAVVLSREARSSNAGLRRTWWHCCREENINPRRPTRLPLLFALDAKLGLADGFRYALDCTPWRIGTAGADGSVYCAGDFGSAAIDGSTEGFGDASSSSSSGSDGSGSSDGGSSEGGSGCGGSSSD